MKPFALYLSMAIILLAGTSATPVNPPHEGHAEGELHWYVKLDEAQAESKRTNKPIFAFFTGSDWCGWCMRLQATVFHKEAFKAWANENVILLELDYPKRKQLPADIAAQNNQLKNFFKPRGFPTIWIFDMNYNDEAKSYQINPFGNLGYPSGSEPGKEEVKFIENANRILANNPNKKEAAPQSN